MSEGFAKLRLGDGDDDGGRKAEQADEDRFTWERHGAYFLMFFKALPSDFSYLDTQRLMLTHFALSGLDILGQLHKIGDRKQGIVDWIYSLQVLPGDEFTLGYCGFRPSPSNGRVLSVDGSPPANDEDCAHLTMTFCALCSLTVMGDSLDRVDRDAIAKSLRYYQKADGSFTALHTGGENDMRFVYCACSICTILGDWSAVDKAAMKSYILNSQTYEGGFAQGPSLEAHGGSTYCAIASLSMLGELDTFEGERRAQLLEWLIARQQTGFNGRPNKLVDTCYTYWIGASLVLLGERHLVDRPALRGFLVKTQHKVMGGFAKHPNLRPDPLHTYLGTAGLAVFAEPGLQPIDPELNITVRSRQQLLAEK